MKTPIQTQSQYGELADRLSAAAREILDVIEVERVKFNAEELYGACTTGATRIVPLAVKAKAKAEIIRIMQIAQKNKVAVYPISTGKNWGYGTSNPVENFCILLDLSLMNKIINFDPELGTVRVEPGVTQGQLLEFMKKHDYHFIVPITGAGPHASLMGNLLERGYGITPHTDHFNALLSLEAILPSGEIYGSTLRDLGCAEINNNFKWGLGPYLDGLFAQSNFGVVVECTISLMRRPESIAGFVFTLKSDADVTLAAEALRKLGQNLPGILGGMNLMNSHRMLAMNAPYPTAEVKKGELISTQQMKLLCRKHHIEAWTGIGGIYGTKAVVKAAKKEIRKQLGSLVKDLRFVDDRILSFLTFTTKILPSFLGKKFFQVLTQRVKNLMDVVSGIPTEAALPLAYWKTDQKHVANQNHNIAKDDCGLIWYSPIVLNKPAKVRQYIDFVYRTCMKYSMESLITLTTVSDRCFDSTIPLLFDRKDAQSMHLAQSCYAELMSEGQKLGFFPYRLGIDQMKSVTGDPNSVSWRLVSKIKAALDPNQILSPGRYCP
jgi:4-cresol dehydrogenase (hydroxylating)